MPEDAREITLAAAHGEQVTALPPGPRFWAVRWLPDRGLPDRRPGLCHPAPPRNDARFIAALVEEFAPDLPPDVGAKARTSLERPIEGRRFGEWIARFYESAASRSIAVT